MERNIALGCALEPGTRINYSSHLKSYLAFCDRHDLSVNPTSDTLSMYIAYECHFVNAKTVKSYLSGIVNSLEGLYPDARANRASALVRNTLSGCLKMSSHTTSRKSPLTRADIGRMIDKYGAGSHDDMLFAAVLATGFNGLNRLGELTWPDSRALQDYRKVIDVASLDLRASQYSFFLPGHKGNRFFEGNTILISERADEANAIPIMHRYMASRASLPRTRITTFLFVRSDGSVPTRSWFLAYLSANFPSDIAGHSVRSGGATDLALRGVPEHLIQKIGRWSSDAFQIYIRTNPAILAALSGLSSATLRP